MTTAFLYKWTEITSGKWYVGSRTKKGCHPSDGYICSSKLVKPMILENQSNWVRQILVIGNSKYILELEAAYLKLLDARKDSMSYNLHNGDGEFSTCGMKRKNTWNKGKKGIQKAWNKGVKSSVETRKKLSESKIGSRNPNYGKIAWNRGLNYTLGPSKLKGTKRSAETIAKMVANKKAKRIQRIEKLKKEFAMESNSIGKTQRDRGLQEVLLRRTKC